MREVKVYITVNTSTSYTDCDKLTLIELFEFYDDLEFYFKKVEEMRKKGGG